MKNLLILISAGILLFSCEPKKQQVITLTVPVYEVKSSDISVYREFIGQTYGQNDIDIRARVQGFLEGIHFQEGSRVKKGQLLYSIDPQPFLEKVAQQMSYLAQAETALSKAESDLNRIRPLADRNAVSKSDLDAAVASFKAAQSEVEAAEAAVRLSKIELGYTKIYAPIDGVIGISQAEVSDLVGQLPNSVILNTVSEIDTIRVRFSISEAEYLTLIRERDSVKYKDKVGLQLILADGSVHPYEGQVDFANRQIDRSTGTLLLQASFPNPEGYIRPGQSAIIRAKAYTLKNGIMVPQRTVTEIQGMYQVALFNSDNTIENRRVEVGPKKGNMWVIEKGLSAGEKIVLENVATRGMAVNLEPEIQDFDVIE
ncbi:efflux RND transporter periplasmic adaptor subunit [Fulvivirga sedimenti]|uniref:Efflux RND transporter periplasmic adaptor subunit n=1 Tax=Fulvivirga sedimenti TaxID=2879465 RepID=A0A9X1L1P5_9BACT|nr:efflux RND transporter periplasmic adaptor subunit [Fulvivirga sedimenti]MCA6078437.1 efflux RND transporter periplasmic adaptor subunit [Fulvivirga sedimenti]